MTSLPWFKIYAAETLSDSHFQGWNCEERGAWFTLVVVCWREGSIPGDQESLARLLHVDSSTMRRLWSAIGTRFVEHLDHPGRLTSPRLEMEREQAEKLHQKRSEAGARGATSRWHKANRPHGKRMANASSANATAMANDSDQDRSEQHSTEQDRSVLLSPEEWRQKREALLAAKYGSPE